MRFVIFILACLIGIAIDVVLIVRFNSYTAPAVVFVALMAIGYWIFRKVPASTVEKRWLASRGQKKIAKSMRRVAYIYIFSTILYFATGQYKILPWWAIPLLIIPFLMWVVYPLWAARRVEQLPEDEWKRRVG